MLAEWKGYHQPAYLETDVGTLHHYRWRGVVDNNNTPHLHCLRYTDVHYNDVFINVKMIFYSE